MPASPHTPTLSVSDRRSSRIVLIGVFLGMSTRGVILPVLPPFIVGSLGGELTTVGLVVAVQSLASLVTRPWAGRLTDHQGGRTTLTIGLAAVVSAAFAYLLAVVSSPNLGIGMLILARLLAGVGEGMIVTGGGAWAVALAGLHQAGSAMTWIGLAIFGGVIVGAAAGSHVSFAQAGCIVLAVSAGGILIVRRASAQIVPPVRTAVPFRNVLRAVFWPGLTLGLAATGLTAVSAYVVLLFEARGWTDGGVAIALFSVGAVCARLLLGRYADRLAGGLAVMVSLCVEACGLGLVAMAPTSVIANMGTVIAGFGFSMIYPWMALPALRQVLPEGRGSVIGFYDAAFDISTALAAALCGLVAAHWGVPAVFYVSAIAVACANVAVLAMNLSPAIFQRHNT